MADDNNENKFSATRYFDQEGTVTVGPRNRRVFFTDGSDAFANNRHLFLSFYHVPSGKSVFFKAFITAFNETYSSDWSSEAVYGRADPIQMFKNTTRNITLSFRAPAASTSEAYENLGRVQNLVQYLYPSYKNVQEAQTIAQSPLIRLKVMNLLKDGTGAEGDSGESLPTPEYLNNYSSTNSWEADRGLLGVITSLSIAHNLEGDEGAYVIGDNTILPKMIEVTLDFSAIHEQPLGWGEDGEFSAGSSFPYGAQTDELAGVELFNNATNLITMEESTDAQRDNAEADAIEALNFGGDASGITIEETVSEAFENAQGTVFDATGVDLEGFDLS